MVEHRYTYCHDNKRGFHEAIDVHEVITSRSKGRSFFSLFSVLLFVLHTSHLLLVKLFRRSPVKEQNSKAYTFLVICMITFPPHIPNQRLIISSYISCKSKEVQEIYFEDYPTNAFNQESIVIMPAFGVQFETYYWSGRVTRRFVSIGEILKPVLNEVVTPVTCYWRLALILRREHKLMLVFQETRPPVKMLVPIWRALCAAANGEAELEESGIVEV